MVLYILKLGRSGYLILILFTAVSLKTLAANDQPFVGSEQISSIELVEAVLSRNPTLPAMQAAWEAARARIEQASALNDPILAYTVAPRTVGAAGLDFGQKLELSQRLPWPGKRRLRGEAARCTADAAHENIETLRLKLVAAAKSIFADWYYVDQAIRINRVNQDLLKEFRRIAEIKYGTGRGTKQDVLRADVEIQFLEYQAIVLERERRDVRSQINTLLNRAPAQFIPPPMPLPDPGSLPDVELLRTRAVESRPNLKGLAAQVRASKARTDLAQREFYPDFNVTAGYNSLWDPEEKRFTVGVGINLPLDQGKRRAAEDEARARMKQADWELIDEMSVIAGEVQRAYDRVEESRQVLALFRERLLPIAEENLEAAKLDYHAGIGDFLTLISAEENLMQTQLQSQRTLADYHRSMAELERSVGGFARVDLHTLRRNEP